MSDGILKFDYDIKENRSFSNVEKIGSIAGEKVIIFPGEDFIFTITLGAPAIFTIIGHGFDTGFKCTLSTTLTLPPELTAGTDYYIEIIDLDTFYLHTTSADAFIGANRIATTGTGTGVLTLKTIDKA